MEDTFAGGRRLAHAERVPTTLKKPLPFRAENINPSLLHMYLVGLDYPSTKQELLEHARVKPFPVELVTSLRSLPEKTYGSALDVVREAIALEPRVTPQRQSSRIDSDIKR